MKTIIAAAASVLLLATTASAADFEEGVHYRELAEQQSTQTGDKVEVRELFWYQCPHCYNLEKPLRDWIATMPDNAAFVEQPAVLTGSWEFHARVYYTLQALGVLDQFHGPLFDAIHKKPRPLNRVTDPARVAAWLEERGGAASEECIKLFEWVVADTDTRNAVIMTGRYEITCVRSVAMGGKYIITVTMAGNYDSFFEVIERFSELASES